MTVNDRYLELKIQDQIRCDHCVHSTDDSNNFKIPVEIVVLIVVYAAGFITHEILRNFIS